jgi:hypothetical protein
VIENIGAMFGGGDPGRIRTCDLQLRRASGTRYGSMDVETFSVPKKALLARKLLLAFGLTANGIWH